MRSCGLENSGACRWMEKKNRQGINNLLSPLTVLVKVILDTLDPTKWQFDSFCLLYIHTFPFITSLIAFICSILQKPVLPRVSLTIFYFVLFLSFAVMVFSRNVYGAIKYLLVLMTWFTVSNFSVNWNS